MVEYHKVRERGDHRKSQAGVYADSPPTCHTQKVMRVSVSNRDSYWVINGLLLSEMTDTAHGMIQNFLYLVNR